MIGRDLVRAHNRGDCWPAACPCCEFEDEQEAANAPELPKCQNCDGVLEIGDTAWADDWTVITADGARIETRYTCDACADGAA